MNFFLHLTEWKHNLSSYKTESVELERFDNMLNWIARNRTHYSYKSECGIKQLTKVGMP